MPREPNERVPEEIRKLSPAEGDVALSQTARQNLALQITVERDPVRLAVLCKKLDQIMLADEREKVQRRLKGSA